MYLRSSHGQLIYYVVFSGKNIHCSQLFLRQAGNFVHEITWSLLLLTISTTRFMSSYAAVPGVHPVVS